MEILAFFAGMLFFYSKTKLSLLLIATLCLYRPKWTMLFYVIVAMAFCVAHQWWTADQGMPRASVIQRAKLLGVISTIPSQTLDKVTFEFDIKRLNDHPVHAHIRLACYQQCPTLHVGQTWQLLAKLRQAHNLSNPGGFDYKTLLEVKHIHWTGYVQKKSFQAQASQRAPFSLMGLREHLSFHLSDLVHEEDALGILQALTLGVTTHISQDLWALFRKTGTTHLMVISGAHIGLIAGMMFQLCMHLWSRLSRFCLRYPAQKISSVVAMMAGFVYALLAGFGVPAERSAVASLFMFVRYLGPKQFGAWQAWRYALFIVLLSEPHAVLMPGFYLSFMAVAILLTMNQRITSTGIVKIGLLQLSCMLGLLPFTLYWFSYGAINGLLANVLAIPWVSFVVVPLALLTLLVGQYAVVLVVGLKMAIDVLLIYLHWVDSLSSINLTLSYPDIILPLAWMVAMALYVLLPIKALYACVLTLLIAVLYPYHQPIKFGEFQANILDVGQGLAVVIRTKDHTVIYDTGGQVYHGPDMGQSVIIPYLHTLSIRRLDTIIISHPDLDHRGGLASLEAQYPGSELIVDNPDFYHRGHPCHQTPDWDWDGIHFHFFPIVTLQDSKNNRSCVLQITNTAGQLLLTGDIEREAEHILVTSYGEALKSTVMVVPHHGSKTSSTRAFLKAVAPQTAVMSYGFDNRYHFPHAQAVRGYQDQGITVFATAEQGMISLWFHTKSLVINSFESGRTLQTMVTKEA